MEQVSSSFSNSTFLVPVLENSKFKCSIHFTPFKIKSIIIFHSVSIAYSRWRRHYFYSDLIVKSRWSSSMHSNAHLLHCHSFVWALSITRVSWNNLLPIDFTFLPESMNCFFNLINHLPLISEFSAIASIDGDVSSCYNHLNDTKMNFPWIFSLNSVSTLKMKVICVWVPFLKMIKYHTTVANLMNNNNKTEFGLSNEKKKYENNNLKKNKFQRISNRRLEVYIQIWNVMLNAMTLVTVLNCTNGELWCWMKNCSKVFFIPYEASGIKNVQFYVLWVENVFCWMTNERCFVEFFIVIYSINNK